MEYAAWKVVHEQQLNGIPEIYWEALFTKLCSENFDAAEYFVMTPSSSGWRVRVSCNDGIKPDDPNSVFLVDHSWTYLPENCYNQLHTIPGLAKRMANMMDLIDKPTTPPVISSSSSDSEEDSDVGVARVNGNSNGTSESVGDDGALSDGDTDNEESEIDTEGQISIDEEAPPTPPSEELVDLIMENIWKYNDCYSVSNVQVPVWYVLEEFGSRIPHSSNPSIGMKPFFHILTQMSHSVIWPLRDLNYGDDLSRNRVPASAQTDLERACFAIPWSPPHHLSLSDGLWAELDSIAPPPLPDYCDERLSDVTPPNSPIPLLPYKVYTDIDLVKKHLKHNQFDLVGSPEGATILWLYDHFKDFDKLPPNCFINQFPFENVLTCKNLLSSVCKANNNGTTPKWLAETYDLYHELPRFVHRYKTLEASESDNIWIIKPWNLGRSLDTHVTRNLNQVIRLVNTVPKIACKYISNPVLFERQGIGKVKMDIRYMMLLVSVKPLILYAYKTFWLRFANKPFSLDSFHDYQKHFTVMNYQDEGELKHIESADFVPMFNDQYPMYPWELIEKEIFRDIWALFKMATAKPPPAGIKEFLQSRGMYSVDLMLEWTEEEGCACRSMQPKLLEVNFNSDTIRACKYHPNYYNHVFECLFLPESLHSDDLPVIKLDFD